MQNGWVLLIISRDFRERIELVSLRAGAKSFLQLLLDRGAQMECVDSNGMRPLDRAISSGHLDAVQCFLKKGAKLGPATWALAGDKHEIMWVSRTRSLFSKAIL